MKFHCCIAVFHADGALKIAPACSKFRLLKAECLALLGRVDVRLNYIFIHDFVFIAGNTTKIVTFKFVTIERDH